MYYFLLLSQRVSNILEQFNLKPNFNLKLPPILTMIKERITAASMN